MTQEQQARGKAGSGWSADHPEFYTRGSDHPEFGPCFDFLSSNISRKQTRQYRKSTKEATSGKRCERKGETNNCSKTNQLVGLIMQAVIGAHCKNFTASRAYM